MIISISGSPGSGKSTVAAKLAKALGYRRYYMGAERRKMAKNKGLTLVEFNAWSEKHIAGDKIVDDYLTKLGQKKNNFVIESRTAWHFIPDSLKIFIYISAKEGAKRIWSTYQNDKQKRNEDNINSLKDLEKSVSNRAVRDRLRYKKHYRINIFQKSNYDLWLDVGKLNKKQEFEAIYQFVKVKLKID